MIRDPLIKEKNAHNHVLMITNLAVTSVLAFLAFGGLVLAISFWWHSSRDTERLWLKIETQQLQINRLERQLELVKGTLGVQPALRERDHRQPVPPVGGSDLHVLDSGPAPQESLGPDPGSGGEVGGPGRGG